MPVKPMLLFIDDDPSILKAIHLVLEPMEQDWDMVFTTDSSEALDMVKKMSRCKASDAATSGEFAVVVSDLCMPGINGIDFFEILHTIFPDTVRILLTAVSDVGFAIRAINDGKVHRYLSKPCLMEDLLPELQSAIEHYGKVKEHREEALSAKRAKALFLDNMTHEIRTPINGIMGMLQLLKDTPLSLEQKEYVAGAMEASGRLARLCGDVLEYSRLESGQTEERDGPVRIDEVLRHVRESHWGKARVKGLTLTCDVDPRIPGRLYGKEGILRQVLHHLTDNAVKFTQAGSVTVSATLLPHAVAKTCRVLFSVGDTGIGAPADKLDAIFQPFTQAASSYARQHQGAGLGLAIVKKLVRLLEGANLTVDSGDGGTGVYLSAVFRLSYACMPWSHPGAPRAGGGARPRRILVVEGDAPILRSLTAMLMAEGHDVVGAATGNEALRQLVLRDCDMIVLDMQLPDMEGHEAVRIIRTSPGLAEKSHVPVVGLAASGLHRQAAPGQGRGVDAVVSKPVNRFALAAAVNRILPLSDASL